MEGVSHNHVHYEARLQYIRRLLTDALCFLGADAYQTEITPISYDADCPFKYNNFVYRLDLLKDLPENPSARGGDQTATQPGCAPIPPSTRSFILRLSNPDAEDMKHDNRVKNEVAIVALTSAALAHVSETNIVPRIYAWRDRISHQEPGWILQELMPGVPLAEPFQTMSPDEKRGILAQMAVILHALQDYRLPDSIQGYGGVMFSEAGAIISAPMPSVGAGPWTSLEDSYRGRMEVALALADENPHLRGWRPNAVRERVEAFIQMGLSERLSRLSAKEERVIVHADLSTRNLLYDPTTGRITAVLDYDFASVQHPAYEFFRSFARNGGQLFGWSGDATPEQREANALRAAKLSGQFPDPLPAAVASDNGPGIDWALALAWEEELNKFDVKRPSIIQGAEDLADVEEVVGSLQPWRLTNSDFLRMNQDKDQLKLVRRIEEGHLTTLLSHLGF